MKRAIRIPLWSVLFVLALGPCVSRTSQQIPAAAKSLVTIPIDVTDYGLIFLRARVNSSQPMWFALDSCARRRLVLEPNAHFAEPIEYDMSGIRFRAEGSDLRTFRVYQVLKESPAAEAGLRVGDVLAAIDGVPASKFSLDEVYKMLKQQEREYKLDVRRGSETFFVKLKMKRII